MYIQFFLKKKSLIVTVNKTDDMDIALMESNTAAVSAI